MRWSIRVQFVLPLIVVLAVLIAFGIASLYQAHQQVESQTIQQLDTVQKLLKSGRFPLTKPVLEQMKQLSGMDFLVLLPNSKPWNELSTQFTHSIPQLNPEKGGFFSADYTTRVVDLPDSHPNFPAEVIVCYPTQNANEALNTAIQPIFLLFGGAIFAIILVAYQGNTLVRKIRSLQRQTENQQVGAYSPIDIPPRNDEIRDLAVTFDQMFKQLSNYYAQQQQMEKLQLISQVGTGLAHQLRNHITGAKLPLELMAQNEKYDEEAIEVSLRQISLLENTLRRFIALQKQEMVPTASRIDPAKLVPEIIAIFQHQAHHARTELSVVCGHGTHEILMNPDLFRDLVINLVMNALEAAAVDGKVQVKCGNQGDFVVITVQDTGFGPPENMKTTLFEPFQTSKKEGIGLGLAIVKTIVEDCHGEISWRRENNWTIFTVKLPAYRGF